MDLKERSTIDDSVLWERFKLGIESAFDQIYRIHFPELLNYGLKFRCDNEFIKDCIQELFAELWTKRTKLGFTTSIRFYLFLSLKRKILKKLKIQKQTIGLDDLKGQYSFDAEFTIEDKIISKEFNDEKRDRLQFALNQLTGRQKEVIYLRFYRQLDVDSVAAMMSLNKQSVRNLLFESIKSLRVQFVAVSFLLVTGIYSLNIMLLNT